MDDRQEAALAPAVPSARDCRNCLMVAEIIDGAANSTEFGQERSLAWDYSNTDIDKVEKEHPIPWSFDDALQGRCSTGTCLRILTALGIPRSKSPSKSFGSGLAVSYFITTNEWQFGLPHLSYSAKDYMPLGLLRLVRPGGLDSDQSLIDSGLFEAWLQRCTCEPIGMAVKDDERVNVNLLTSWVQVCDEQHVGICYSFDNRWAQIEPATDLLFIDVHQNCLVSVARSKGVKYVALSYVWGHDQGKEIFQTLEENLPSLKEPGAFRSHLEELPWKIRDSMVLVSKMKIRYLWVDRFCIVQDHKENLPAQLAAMAAIYANAYFTLAACEGDAYSGLAGVDNFTRRSAYSTFDFSENCQMLTRDPDPDTDGFLSSAAHNHSEIDEDIYYDRGWTYQEWALSRRIIAFHDQTVSWKCRKRTQQENGAEAKHWLVPHAPEPTTVTTEDLIWTQWPSIKRYIRDIENYSRRDLTHKEDKLKAFDAIMSVHGRSMEGGFWWGIPELFFNALLLWRPTSGRSSGSSGIPSWSWASWNGPVDMGLADCAVTYIHSKQSRDREKLAKHFLHVQMYVGMDGSADTATQLIKDHVYWTKQFQEDGNQLITGPALPEDLERLSRLPLKTESNDNSPNATLPHPRILRFKSAKAKAYVIICRTPQRRYIWPRAELTSLYNKSGAMVGCLEVDITTLAKDRSVMRERGRIGLRSLHLLRIGGLEFEWNSVVASLFPDAKYLHRRQGCEDGCYDDRDFCVFETDWTFRFYNVLWVEWRNGVAYRKGIGRVWAHCWDALEAEDIDVLLG